MKLWDISPLVHAQSPVFPGDAPYRLQWTAHLGPDCPVNLSAVHMSPHVGAHADAPLHYAPDGASIDAVPLAPYLGPCRVVYAIDCGPLVQVADLAHALPPGAVPQRVLVRTCRQADTVWRDDFAAFAPATLEWLASQGVLLVGIDTPSVDPANSKDLQAHQQLRQHGLRVLENLVLDDVPEGDYELIALPLKLHGACASPVRAVLRALP